MTIHIFHLLTAIAALWCVILTVIIYRDVRAKLRRQMLERWIVIMNNEPQADCHMTIFVGHSENKLRRQLLRQWVVIMNNGMIFVGHSENNDDAAMQAMEALVACGVDMNKARIEMIQDIS